MNLALTEGVKILKILHPWQVKVGGTMRICLIGLHRSSLSQGPGPRKETDSPGFLEACDTVEYLIALTLEALNRNLKAQNRLISTL